MPIVSSNTDINANRRTPGIYFQINTRGGSPGPGKQSTRMLLLGQGIAGTAPFNVPQRVISLSDEEAKNGVETDITRMARAALDEIGGGVADIYTCKIADPSGTKSAWTIIFAGTATSTGGFEVFVGGRLCASVGVNNGDTGTVIGAAVATALSTNLGANWTVSPSTGTVTITYPHVGLNGEDLALRVNQSGATGVTASPGTLLFATAISTIGTFTIASGGSSLTIATTDTEAASALATAVNTAINAASLPFTSTVNSATVTLLYQNGRDVRRITAKITTSTGTTINGVAAGSTAYIGTASSNSPGTGTVSLTTALANIAALKPFVVWAHPFADSTSVGTIANHIELYSNGKYQKRQFVICCSSAALATAGAISSGSSPALTGLYREALLWTVDSPEQSMEWAARWAAEVINVAYPAKNFDGFTLKTRGSAPFLVTAPSSRPGPDDIETAMATYGLTPLVVDDLGNWSFVRAMTTYLGVDQDLYDPSAVMQLDNIRDGLDQRLWDLFKGKDILLYGPARTSNTFTAEDMIDAIVQFLGELQAIDLYDGVDTWKKAISVTPDKIVPTTLDIAIPASILRPFHIGQGSINKV